MQSNTPSKRDHEIANRLILKKHDLKVSHNSNIELNRDIKKVVKVAIENKLDERLEQYYNSIEKFFWNKIKDNESNFKN